MHKKRPLDPSVINDQILDLFAGQSPTIVILEKDYLELKSEVGYWKAMHAKAVEREQPLKDKIKVLEGQIRDLKQRVFSKQNEKTGTKKGEGKSTSSNPKRPRGQQPGSEGHGLISAVKNLIPNCHLVDAGPTQVTILRSL